MLKLTMGGNDNYVDRFLEPGQQKHDWHSIRRYQGSGRGGGGGGVQSSEKFIYDDIVSDEADGQ